MAAVPQRVLNWLYSILTSEYRDVNRTYGDVAQALSHYSSLSPRTDIYTYGNGQPALLLVISGTLPVTFRGATYRFPISIWIPHAYPREAPIVYVTPTEEMIVRPGQHVSGDGRCYHPYLAGWAEFWARSNVLDLLAVLRDVFAKEPPVISKQQQYRPPQQPGQQVAAPPPVPPLPPELSKSPPPTSSAQPATTAPPAVPPPPPPKPYETRDRTQSAGTIPGLSQTNSPPPLRPLPGKVPTQYNVIHPNGYVQSSNFQPQRSSSLRTVSGPPPTSVATPPNIQQTQQYDRSYGPVSPVSPVSQWQQPFPPAQQQPQRAQMRYGPPNPPLASPPPRANVGYQQNIPPPTRTQPIPLAQQQQYRPQPKPAPPKEDLLSSDLALPLPQQAAATAGPPPPIPPNPQKDYLLQQIAQQLLSLRRESLQQTNTSLPALKSQYVALTNAHHALLAELNELKSLDAVLTSNEHILQDSMRRADEVIASAAGREVPGVDEVLVAPTVVGKQLYELACEERAIGDVLFVLGRALERERIGVDVFLKQTRGLAREQFLKKALIKKISRGMGLVEDSHRR